MPDRFLLDRGVWVPHGAAAGSPVIYDGAGELGLGSAETYAAVLDGYAGVWTPTGTGWQTSSQVNPADNTFRAGRFYLPRPMTIVGANFYISAFTAGTVADVPIDIGLLDATGTPIFTTGALTGLINSTGLKQATFATPQALAAGVYYAGMSPGGRGTTTYTLVTRTANVEGPAVLAGTAPPQPRGIAQASRHPIGAGVIVPVAPSSSAGYAPWALFLRE